jgi:hypothetical protein
MSRSPVNPFGDLIVKDPRRPEAVLSGLNGRPLRQLIGAFDRLALGAAPRPQVPSDGCYLVSSSQPGYGKSHLIGRLFRELHGRGTLVYVLPFQNAATVFQSLMLAVSRELHFPDRMDVGSWDREQPTQLDFLAHAVLAHLVADIVATGRDIHVVDASKEEVIERLRSNPLEAFNRGVTGPNWADWLRAHFGKLREPLEAAVARLGLNIAAPATWLRMLYAYAFNPFDTAVRRACLDWLTAQPVDQEDLQRIGLRAAEGVTPEISPDEANELCRQRLVELCQLASFFRPFVFCFDQTEVYGHHAALARAFGKVIAVLVNETPNQFALVTCNQDPWTERIVPYIEVADLQRIISPPVTLEGITRSQANDLIRLRVSAVDGDESRASEVLDEGWLTSLFPTANNQMGARLFLQKCKERWDAEPAPAISLEDLYQQRINRLLASPKRHQFEPDTLQWLVEEVATRLPGVTVEKLEEKYFQVQWKTAERLCLFGFVPGSYWKRWLAIAKDLTARNEGQAALPIKGIFFRAPLQPPIPGNWKSAPEINTARQRCLHIVQLRTEDLAELYAARDLFAEAAQGDIAAQPEAVLEFLVQRLTPWWNCLRGPVQFDAVPQGEAPVERTEFDQSRALAEQLREIVKRSRFLSLEEAAAALKDTNASREEVLTACGFSPEIKVHSHPNMVVLQWQNSA